MLEIFSGPLPWAVSVIDWAVLGLPIASEPNGRLEAEIVGDEG